MFNLAQQYYHTLKFLQWTQIKYRLLYQLKKRSVEIKFWNNTLTTNAHFTLSDSIPSRLSWLGNNTFSFLNTKHKFQDRIDWNYKAEGKLWTYNLNYFEFLNQPNLSKEEGLDLIHDFINQIQSVKDGMESFPISLRCIFWIKFLLKHQISDQQINQALYAQLQILSKRPEYHLLGNHLLENGFSLLFGGYYFESESILAQAKKILREQISEQILEDGAHFELSPMYHQIMLYRLLDCINLLQNNIENSNEDFQTFLTQKAAIMLGWLEQMTFQNGDLPNVNDSVSGIAPDNEEIVAYADRLGVKPQRKKLKGCGYRKIKRPTYEMLVDVGKIGPDYIPGHAHSDTFSFVLHCQGQPLVIDSGISTYEKNPRRNLERSTASHNTVMVEGLEQSEVWGGFRVARRAKIIALQESENQISASHDGYKKINCEHQRIFSFEDNSLSISDHISGNKKGTAFFHFHSSANLQLVRNTIYGSFGTIQFSHLTHIQLHPYLLATGFNQTTEAVKIVVRFKDKLHTKFIFQ